MADELDELTKVEDDSEESAEVTESTEDAEETEKTKGEEEAAPPAAEETQDATVPIAALMAEREKRQDLEKQLAQKADDPTPRPDAIEDPEGAVSHIETAFDAKVWQMKCDLARDLMSSTHDDYEAKEAEFLKMAESNPHLVTEMMAAANPARYAYETATKAAELEALKDVDGYKDTIREQVREEEKAKLLAEMSEESERDQAHAAAAGIPSLAKATAAKSSEALEVHDEDLAALCDGR